MKPLYRQIARKTRIELVKRFPQVIMARGEPKRPLAIGICSDLRLAVPDLSGRSIRLFLRDYATGMTYLQAIAAGGPRYALDGTVKGEVSEQAKEIARNRIERHRQGVDRAQAARETQAEGAPS